MNIVNDILVNALFPDTDFVQTLAMNSVVPKYVENQEKGNPSVCKNCAESPFKDLHIYGRSEQMTTTGAQLLDLDALELRQGTGATIKRLDDGGFLVNGTPKTIYEQYIKPLSLDLEPGTYYISGGEYSAGSVITQVNITNADDTKVNYGNKKFNIYGTEKEVVLVIQSTSTNPINNYKVCPMLNKGSVAMPFEPYTGGKPSPSPDYPQEIVNAGEDGNIGVEVHGKNIFGGRYYYARYSNGILFIDKRPKDEEVKFPYQPETESAGICKALKCRKGKTYVISVTNPNKNAAIGMAEYENIEKTINTNNALGFVTMYDASEKSYTAKSDGILVCGIAGTWTDGKTTLHECTESELLQVEEASEATSYEPYHEPQSMSVTTPNGLPGIPVSSGGNYTDENGQQWICDEVDLGRGVYVQRVAEAKIKPETAHAPSDPKWYDSEKSYSYEAEYAEFDIDNTGNRKGFCSHLSSYTFGEFYNKGIETGWLGTFSYGVFNFSKSLGICKTKDEFLTWIQDVKIYKILNSPIETPLTASEIAAYKSLRTYRGTTIVEAEDKAGIYVKYNMPMPKLSKNGALRRWFKRHPII